MGLDMVLPFMEPTADRTLVFASSTCPVTPSDWSLAWSQLRGNNNTVDSSKAFMILALSLISLLFGGRTMNILFWYGRNVGVSARTNLG